jgi:hypothetical protein
MSWVRYNATGKKFEGSSDNGATWVALDLSGQGLPAGNVAGPASAVSGNLASYDGTTGKLLKDSGISVTSTGKVGIGTTTPGSDLEVCTTNYGISVSYGDAENFAFLCANGSDVSVGRNIKTKPGSWAKNDATKPSAGWVFGSDGSGYFVTSPATQTTPLYLVGLLVRSTGAVQMPNLPISPAGLSTGDIWIDTGAGNVLKIVT